MRNVVVTLRLCFAIKLLQLLMTIELIMLQMECLFTHTSWQTSTAAVTSSQKKGCFISLQQWYIITLFTLNIEHKT